MGSEYPLDDVTEIRDSCGQDPHHVAQIINQRQFGVTSNWNTQQIRHYTEVP